VGQATRVSEYLMASEKTYRAAIQLGTITDTYDTDGEVVETRPLGPEVDRGAIWASLGHFVGDIMQAPPAYSAIKQDGVPLHRRVRRGEDVRPAPRPVHIHSIQLIDWTPPCLTVDVTCDPGTYIRSLAHDLGRVLGCGGALSGLRRTRSGRFHVEDALSPDAVADAYRAGDLARHLHPMNAALSQLAPVPVSDEEIKRLRNGQPIAGHPASLTHDGHAREGYALGGDGAVIAILRWLAIAGPDGDRGEWWPDKVFAGE
jgi:tRNA pseudouridine55 synthase